MLPKEKKERKVSRREFIKDAAIAGAAVAATSFLDLTPAAAQGPTPTKWDYEADVVVIGAGAAGLPAAIRARDLGASVLVVEANWMCGGHAMTSGAHQHLGGGHSLQKKKGVVDSADQYYLDHTEPRVVLGRYDDRAVVRTAADNHAAAFEFLLANGLVMNEDTFGGGTNSYLKGGTGADTVPRDVDPIAGKWVSPCSNKPDPQAGMMRPLEVSARKKGVRFLLNHHMDVIHRETPNSGRVLGVTASYKPTILPGTTTPMKDPYKEDDFTTGNIESTATVTIKAKKAVVIATGGSSSNWKFHQILDPRIGPEHNGVGGDPFSFQDASGELAAMAIGASLGDVGLQVNEGGSGLSKGRAVGCQYAYRQTFTPESPIFPLVRAVGLALTTDSEAGLIYVNMLGQRFYQEDTRDYNWLAAALGSAILDKDTKMRRVAGPIWAIFDADQVTRNKWNVSGPPYVDIANGYFFSGSTLAELAGKIVNKFYESYKLPAANLQETVSKYNSFVDTGKDTAFGRKTPKYKIQTPPFYAAWLPNAPHDTLTCLWVNGKFQVRDIRGEPIPSLYCVGESASGQSMHGHGKNISSGYAVGLFATEPTPW